LLNLFKCLDKWGDYYYIVRLMVRSVLRCILDVPK
jgi:hypothetical protein